MPETELRDSVIKLTSLVERLGEQIEENNRKIDALDHRLTSDNGVIVRLRLVEESHKSLRTAVRACVMIVISNLAALVVAGATWIFSRLASHVGP